jgi:hypothetical protein
MSPGGTGKTEAHRGPTNFRASTSASRGPGPIGMSTAMHCADAYASQISLKRLNTRASVNVPLMSTTAIQPRWKPSTPTTREVSGDGALTRRDEEAGGHEKRGGCRNEPDGAEAERFGDSSAGGRTGEVADCPDL